MPTQTWEHLITCPLSKSMRKNIMKRLTYGRRDVSFTRWWLSTRPSRRVHTPIPLCLHPTAPLPPTTGWARLVNRLKSPPRDRASEGRTMKTRLNIPTHHQTEASPTTRSHTPSRNSPPLPPHTPVPKRACQPPSIPRRARPLNRRRARPVNPTRRPPREGGARKTTRALPTVLPPPPRRTVLPLLPRRIPTRIRPTGGTCRRTRLLHSTGGRTRPL